MCGEKSAFLLRICILRGSPPRVRGEVIRPFSGRRAPRITPACAGRSSTNGSRISRPKDHPRVCGEKTQDILSASIRTGSPPRVRGEGPQNNGGQHRQGITPACAGRSLTPPAGLAGAWDHPRVCGEKQCYTINAGRTSGSPPRVRGEVCYYYECRKMAGITPACAGRRIL